MSNQNTYGPGDDNYGRDKKMPNQTNLSVEAMKDRFVRENMLHGKTAEYTRLAIDYALKSNNLVSVEEVERVLDEHFQFNHVENKSTLINQIKNLTIKE